MKLKSSQNSYFVREKEANTLDTIERYTEQVADRQSIHVNMNTFLTNDQGDFFLLPILDDKDKQRQQLHVKQHEDDVTLCNLQCSREVQILKELPSKHLQVSWNLCSLCWEKAKMMKLTPASEINDSIFERYKTFQFGHGFLAKNQLSQNYLNRASLYDITDMVRWKVAKILPDRAKALVRPPVRRHHWDIKPMPDSRKPLTIEQEFSKNEFSRIKAGYYPETMEEKWFVFYENGWLYFHYAWTGFCIFQLRFQKNNGKIYIAESWINCDPNQVIDDRLFDSELLIRLLTDLS